MLNLIQTRIQKSVDRLAQAFAPILEAVVPIVEALLSVVRPIAAIVGWALKWKAVSYALTGIFAIIAASMAAMKIANFVGVGVKGFNAMRESLSGMKEGIKSLPGLFGKVKKGFSDAFNTGMGKIQAKSGQGKDLAEKATEDTKKLADSTGGVKPGAGEGPKGFLKGLGDGLASIGKQFGNVVKGALALGIAGLALGVSFALALRMVKDVDPAQMLAFAGSLTMLGLTLALLGNVGGQIIQGALAMGILGIALIPAAFAFSLLADIKPGQMFAFAGALTLLGLAAAGLGFLFPFIAAGAGAIALLGASLIPAAFAFNLLGNTPIESIIQQLTGLAMVAPQLLMVGAGLMSIAAGLGAVAIAGIMALPALAGLGLVMTPLLALGGLFGEGGGEEDNSMVEISAKLDTLISVISAGGDVYLDGDKVGMPQAKSITLLS